MTPLNVRQIDALLRLVRADSLEQLGVQVYEIAPLRHTIESLVRGQAVQDLPRQRGILARQLIETAIRSLATRGRERDLRAVTLLDAFYLQQYSRAETLARLKLGGGSFDRVKVDALGKLTDALNQFCATIDQPVAALGARTPAMVPDAHKCQHLPYRPYRVLWGRQREVAQVLTWLDQSYGLPVICISGLGGSGKTALARHVAEAWCNRADVVDVVWVSAKRELLVGAGIQTVQAEPLTFAGCVDQLIVQTGLAEAANRSLADQCAALSALFQKKNFLIVLDNLDGVKDEIEFTQQILNVLGQARLMITTRHQHIDALPVVHSLHLGGLSETESIQLLREEAGYRGAHELARAERDLLCEIYTQAGGVPLALHLVIGQAHVFPLATVLAHLRQARALDTEFYSFLFKQDWLLLDETAQKILIYIGRMIRTSITYAQLRHAHIIKREVDTAIELLIKLSLLETNGSLLETEKRYSIHPLVRYFVVSGLPDLWKPQTI